MTSTPVTSTPIKRLTQALMDEVAEQARNSPRLRQHRNFHNTSEKVQRFINVLQLGTYVRPHRHIRMSGISGFEFFLVLRGELGLLILDHQGEVVHTERMSDQGSTKGLEVAGGIYHTIVALAPDTTILELREGPYDPSYDKQFLSCCPIEGTPEADQIVVTWQSYF